MIPHKLTHLFESRLPVVPTSVHPLNDAFQSIEFKEENFGVPFPRAQDKEYYEESHNGRAQGHQR
jgi:hypothetical protein